jgi:predicted N-acyltransferase
LLNIVTQLPDKLLDKSQTADFEIQIVSSVTEIGQEAWDRLGGGQPFTTYRWYCFGETILVGDVPLYVILSHQGEPVARCTFWLTRQEPVPMSSRLVRGTLQAVLRRWPLLVCRSPFASMTGLILPDSPLRDPALEIIGQIAQALGCQHRASFVVFDYLNRDTQGVRWPNRFVLVDWLEPGTRLNIRWPDFESYVSDLRKSALKDYRRHCNRANDLGIEIKYQSHVTDVERALVLVHNVEHHHNSTPNPYARWMLENAEMVDATWLTAEIEGRIVGCGLLLGDAGMSFLALLGLDYEVRYAYFQLIYAAIRRAIETGTKVLRGGGGAYEIKQRLGFEIESDNHLVFTANNSLLRWVTRRFGSSPNA